MNNFKENIRSERTCKELGKKKKKKDYTAKESASWRQ